jgi:hypothetical protein
VDDRKQSAIFWGANIRKENREQRKYQPRTLGLLDKKSNSEEYREIIHKKF